MCTFVVERERCNHFLISRMRSHFHGSLRHPSQVVTSPHQDSSFTTLPASGYHPQPSFTNTDGNPSLQSYTTTADDVPYKSLPVGATSAGSKVLPPQSVTAPQPLEDVICCLCDRIADTKLIPCNHVVLCEEHAKLSKKCPECRVSCHLSEIMGCHIQPILACGQACIFLIQPSQRNSLPGCVRLCNLS